MKGRMLGPALALPIVFLVTPSCISPKSLGRAFIDEDASAGPNDSFFAPDAGRVIDAAANDELTAYCPSSECPAGWTTCSTSRFPCDVNLRSDPRNCGACGNACAEGTFGSTSWVCAEGKCVMVCGKPSLDCDGLPDNGCEVSGTTNDDCGACGKKCEDPAKPCLGQPNYADRYDCGCPPPYIYCNGYCLNPTNDDENCGKCTNACDPTGGGKPMYDNGHYGCLNSECGKFKCDMFWGDCDHEVTTGCETLLVTPENCGGCGIQCAPGQECILDEMLAAKCMCPPGKTLCNKECYGDLCTGVCRDLTSDPNNCGACGFPCVTEAAYSTGVCNFGTCGRKCLAGRADCNGNEVDGCEIDTNTDPRNCGACGRTCDLLAGQACVGGECVVEPCNIDSDAGVEAR